MSPVLPRSFYARDTLTVARDLLGTRLIRLLPDGTHLSGIIVETEAYRPGDRASHAYRGRSERNAAMFASPGTAYVYFTYGMYHCLNIVTESEGIPAAVLIRALEPVEGVARMHHIRASRSKSGKPIALRDLCRGPGRLCLALEIDKRLNAYDMLQEKSALYVEQGTPYPDAQMRASPRIGVFGDETALNAKWRWYVAGNIFVSHSASLDTIIHKRNQSLH
jgi:DNA-3-methyladenine glycosylase